MSIVDREYDPLTGLVTSIGFEDGKMHIQYKQNVEDLYERNQKLRNADEYTKIGIQKNFWHCVHIPDADCLKMMVEDGINPYTCTAQELRKHLSRNRDKYGHLFTTRGNF